VGFRETDQPQTKGVPVPVLRIDSFELQSSNKLTTDALHGIHDVATPPMAVEPGYGNSMLNFITPMSDVQINGAGAHQVGDTRPPSFGAYSP
jgi:hypothetical protein